VTVPIQRTSSNVPRSRLLGRSAVWLSVAVLVAGVVAALVVFVGKRDSPPAPAPAAPAARSTGNVATPQKNVPLPKAARVVAGRFILTAVARKNLAEAYRLVTPALKQGATLKEWLTGNIPVVPFPVGARDVAAMDIVYSRPKEAELRVVLLPKKGPGATFRLHLKATGGAHPRWLVDSWTPVGVFVHPIGNN